MVNNFSSSEVCYIKCVNLHTRSICNKLNELNFLLASKNIGLACLTESWLGNHITNSMIVQGNRYKVYRKDRDSRGGGVAIIASADYVTQQVLLPAKFNSLEIVCIDIIG